MSNLLNSGIKETEGKLNYEFDWHFIEAMAKRMQSNKGKYEPYNWKKPIDVESLKQALNRHHVEIMKGNYDDTDELDHLTANACNLMMLWYQLKNYQPSTVYSEVVKATEVTKPTIVTTLCVVFNEDIPLKSQWIEKETVNANPVEVKSIQRIDEHDIVSVAYTNGRGTSMGYKTIDFLRIYEPYTKVD